MDEDFKKFIESEKTKINKIIQDYYKKTIMVEEESFLREFLTYGENFIIQGGRRLHPICLIETFKGLSSEIDILNYLNDVYKVSISIELLHVSNLMLDDLIDDEQYRRGKKTFHRYIAGKLTDQYEIASAIYGGNLTSLFGSSIITKCSFDSKRKSKALKIYLDGLIGITRSNLLDQHFKQIPREQITLENYLILADKRAKQIETAVGLGCVFGNARESQTIPLLEAMKKIGIIEQMRNDYLGTFGNSEEKSIEADIKLGQATILSVLAYQSANKSQKFMLNRILGNKDATSAEIQKIRDIYKETGAVDFVRMYSNSLKNDVYNSLKQIYPGLRQETMVFYGKFLQYITEYEG